MTDLSAVTILKEGNFRNHPSITDSCQCLHINNHFNPKTLYKNTPVAEYLLWQEVHKLLTENPGRDFIQYISIPTDFHKCINNYYLEFHVDGDSLINIMHRHREHPEHRIDIQSILLDVARGVSYLNNLGICHMDVKPDNIIVQGSKQSAKLIDLGRSTKIGQTLNLFKSFNTSSNQQDIGQIYPYDPPLKLYHEQWFIDKLHTSMSFTQAQQLSVAITNYLVRHRQYINIFTDIPVKTELQLTQVYRTDDPFRDIIELSNRPDLVSVYISQEHRSWDTFSLGVTILQCHYIAPSYLLELAVNMCRPDACTRPSLSQVLKIMIKGLDIPVRS